MSSATGRGKNGRAGRGTVELHIFAAVERLLSEGESFTALGIQRIADEAAIARSSFYLNFADKSDLLIRLTEAATDGLFGVAERWLEHPDALTRAALRGTLEAVIAEYRRHVWALTAMNEVATYDAAVAAFWTARMTRFSDALTARLERDRTAGRVAAGVDLALTAHCIAWGTERSVAAHIGAGGTDDERLAAALSRSIWLTMYGDD
jgi:AcrR family transcriptional regulator